MGFTQKQVARLLGHRDTSMVSHYERGRSYPPLPTALSLEIIYRTPVAFLFPGMHDDLKARIRRDEENLAGPGQQPLLLNHLALASMNHILDRFVSPTAAFQPKTLSEFFALRLARKLKDEKAVRHYASLADGYLEDQLLCAYRRAKRNTGQAELGRRFHAELERTHANGHSFGTSNQISIRIERRTVAAAIFRNGHLEHTDSRQLSSARDKATSSAVGLIDWLITRFPVEFATLESIEIDHDIQRRALHDAICAMLRERSLSIWEVPRQELLDSCGVPPLKTRTQLREVATAIWPILSGTHAKLFVQDAAILGLHVQTERLFITN